MFKPKQSILTVVEICSSKVVCIIAKIEGKKSEILGIGYVKSDGVRSGIISDIELAQSTVKNAVNDAEKVSGIKVGKVFLSLSSNYLLSQSLTTEIPTISKSITHRELNKLLMDAIQICKNRDLEVIHTFACNYILDGQHGISNPLGMFGNRLSCNFHILSVASNSILNLHTVLSKAGLEINGYIAGIYSSGLSILSQAEIDNGIILIDFGSEVTSIGIFQNEQLIYVDSIPIGGRHITSDIAKIFCIPKSEAERLKNIYGLAIKSDIDSNDVVEIKRDNEKTIIKHDELTAIIQARLEEILHIVESKIKEFKINNVVITGGTARISLLKDLINTILNCKTRVGYPQNIDFSNNNSLELTSVLGVIKHVVDNMQETSNTGSNYNDQTNNKQKLFTWLKRTFFS